MDEERSLDWKAEASSSATQAVLDHSGQQEAPQKAKQQEQKGS